MSDYIVLVKQVPDVTQITDNAFDPETGTLIRTRLASVINELDTQALGLAQRMRDQSGDRKGKIVCLTMGPPMAEEVLRYCLGRVADAAVLLTDRALGGADTVATANPLAFAIRRIVKDLLGRTSDYYVVCGMQSVDGDTAQVPPQIAEELHLACIAYVTGVEYKNGRFEFTRIISGGSQVVVPVKLPAVITVAKYEYPPFVTFAGARRANKMQVISWGADDINATSIGVKGSRTAVIRVFPPGKSTRKCRHITDVKSLGEILISSFSADKAESAGDKKGADEHYVLPARRADRLNRSFEGTLKENEDFEILTDKLRQLGVSRADEIDQKVKQMILAAAGERFHQRALDDMLNGLLTTAPSYKGEVWVVAEQSNGTIHPATFELVGKARLLAGSLETQVGVCLAGYAVEPLARELIAAGADNVYVVEDPLLATFDPGTYCKAVADTIGSHWPQVVLFAATPQGRMLAPMVSYKLGCGLTADCTGLDIRDSSRKQQIAILMQTRPALGGNVMATIYTKNSRSQMATARPGVMKRQPADYSKAGRIIKQTVPFSQDDVTLKILRTERSSADVSLGAPIIVSGGKGMQNRDNYERLVGMLCDSLTRKFGAMVERGASRAAVEQGFVDRKHQVGQTGTSVGPKLYVALGISGAIQHMIGLANTETIVAVNSDPQAPIFKNCDYYIVGNVETIVPQLAQQLETQ